MNKRTEDQSKRNKPALLLHNDGQDWFCTGCLEVIHRTRSNPYPEHECEKKEVKDAAP